MHARLESTAATAVRCKISVSVSTEIERRSHVKELDIESGDCISIINLQSFNNRGCSGASRVDGTFWDNGDSTQSSNYQERPVPMASSIKRRTRVSRAAPPSGGSEYSRIDKSRGIAIRPENIGAKKTMSPGRSLARPPRGAQPATLQSRCNSIRLNHKSSGTSRSRFFLQTKRPVPRVSLVQQKRKRI